MTDQTRIRTSLERHVVSPLTPAELEALCARCWTERGIVVILPEQISNDFIRQGLINEVTVRYGRRMKR